MFKLPEMKDVKPQAPREDQLPRSCSVDVTVYKVKPIFTRAKESAIIPVFTVDKIHSQDPAPAGVAANGKAYAAERPLEVGKQRSLYFALEGEYGYGEQEWALFMQGCGIEEGEFVAAQELALGEANAFAGMKLHIERIPSVSGKGAKFTRLVIEPLSDKAA